MILSAVSIGSHEWNIFVAFPVEYDQGTAIRAYFH